MKILFTFLFSSFFYLSFANANISCVFKVDKMFQIESGKFKKMKIYDDEKIHNVKITNLKSTFKNSVMQTFSGILNGALHVDRKVEITERERIVHIVQTDAYSFELFAHYSIFKTQSNKKGMMSFMYTVFPSNFGHGAVKLYKGHCNFE